MIKLFKINILTYLFFLLSFLAGYYKEILLIYLILIIHEIGHIFFMKLYNIKINKVTLYPYGGMIKSNILINTNSKKILLISLGGIIFQIFLIIIVYIIYKLNILNYYIYNLLIKNNILIIIFNLLPIYPLDGYKILNSILELFYNFKISIIISFILNIITLVTFIIYIFLNKINNYIIIIFFIINLLNYIKEIKYILNKFYIERYIYDLKYDGLISINNINKIYKNKLNYINGINEKDILIKKFAK